MGRVYREALGTERTRQLALSPTHHAAGRKDGVEQSEALGAALERAGKNVELARFRGIGMDGHAEINRKMGSPDYAATPVVERWLKQIFGR